MDDALEATKRKYKRQHVGWPEDQFKHKESLEKAKNALTAAEASLRARGMLLDALGMQQGIDFIAKTNALWASAEPVAIIRIAREEKA
jgi:hypothetical protein